jgi:hypothetical protein
LFTQQIHSVFFSGAPRPVLLGSPNIFVQFFSGAAEFAHGKF